MSLLKCSSVFKAFGNIEALCDVSIDVNPGDILAVVGESGCGKTTLLRAIAGFETIDNGEINIKGQTVSSDQIHVLPENRNLGMVFQEYSLFPHMNVESNIIFGLRPYDSIEKKNRVKEVLDLVRLPGYENRYPHELSGGQQQRIALARSLAPNPTLMLLDEPFSNLDSVNRVDMLNDLQSIIRDSQMATILVTHDKEEAFSVADNLAVMVDGKINQYDKPNEIYFYPKNYKVAKLVSNAEFISGNVNNGVVDCFLGSFPYFDSTGQIDSKSEVTVMIRFGDFRAVYDPNGNFFVTSIEFKGSNYIVTVKSFKGATYIKSVESLDTNLAINSKVNLVPINSDPLLVFPKVSEEND